MTLAQPFVRRGPRAVRLHATGAVSLFALAGCGAITLDDVSRESPTFDFEAYFEGPTRASGWFANRSGEPTRHFCGDFVGSRDGDDFVLDEVLYYTDGVVEERVWRVRIDGERFTASGDALVGEVDGELRGNALRMQYTMTVSLADDEQYTLDFNDFMLLQPDGSLHNATQVKKFGVRLGTVTTQYVHHDGSQSCTALGAGP